MDASRVGYLEEAVTSVLAALRKSLVGARLRRGAELAKVLEAALKRALAISFQQDIGISMLQFNPIWIRAMRQLSSCL